jgi:Plasmid pRiA4b ORF-3-like protein
MNAMPTLPEIYQIKVTLLGTRPPIWRRLLVPSEWTLEQLHALLQAAMGWESLPPA